MYRRIAAVALLSATSGCFELDMSLGPGFFNSGGGGCDWFCDTFWLQPRTGYRTMLLGDTMRVQIGFAPDAGVTARHWRVTGRSYRIVDGDSLVTALARPSSTVLLRAVATGSDTLRALAAVDTTLQATLALRVVDSSAITAISVSSPPSPTFHLQQRASIWVSLTDHTGEAVTWMKPAFTISDTTVVVADGVQEPAYGTNVLFKPLREGEVDVTLRFGGLRRIVHLIIVKAP